MEHNTIRHKLSDFLDNAVSATEKAEIEAHLKSCTICSDALEELRKTVEQVKQIEDIEPPAWMTQKIMAKVRAEAEVKKRWYERLFFPLAVKLPIQAVAVLFLAVGAYYVYQNTNPAGKYGEAPVDQFEAAKPAGPTLAPPPEAKMQQEPAAPAKEVPQTPQYKVLDMKQEYEKKPPPAPLAKAGAPAPAASAAPAMERNKDAAFGRQTAAPRAAAPAALQDKAERSTAREAEPSEGAGELKKARSAAAAETAEFRLSLSVIDSAAADKKIEDITRELKGTFIGRDIKSGNRTLTVSLDTKMLNVFKEKLEKLGELKEQGTASASYGARVQVEITLTPAARP